METFSFIDENLRPPYYSLFQMYNNINIIYSIINSLIFYVLSLRKLVFLSDNDSTRLDGVTAFPDNELSLLIVV